MLLAGDEIGRTQQGNNNAYCQDNEISWLDWNPEHVDKELLHFVQRMITLRKEHPAFRRRRFFQGRAIKGAKDIVWLRPDGKEMTDQEWDQAFARCLGVLLSGEAAGEIDDRGQIIRDSNFVVLINAHHEQIPFILPLRTPHASWLVLVDTSCQPSQHATAFYSPADSYPLHARSLTLLVERRSDQIRIDDRRRSQPS
jgi:isoamylase